MSQKSSSPPDPLVLPDRRARNRAARRQRILDAAGRLIAEGGVEALSMRKLAHQAGLSVTTLYNLFGARGDILRSLVGDAINRMDQVLERDAPLDDPIERCRAVITVSIRHQVENEGVFRPMVMAHFQDFATRDLEGPGVSTRAARMQSVAIRAAIEQGLLRDTLDPDALGRQIYHGYEHANAKWAFGIIDAEEFTARSLYGLNVALLGVANETVRDRLEAELRELEARLAACARAQVGAESGLVDHMVFGRNEPALHHYHSTYRRALAMEPLERIPG